MTVGTQKANFLLAHQ